jgi:drug/metabolite transporter (DMT)-like permease
MTKAALALVIAAAVLHAGWNALAKRGLHPLPFLWSSVSLATLLLSPLAAATLRVQGLARSALPFVGATIVLHAVYFYVLGRAYRSGAFSLVYPVARGLGVALVPILALVLLEERLPPSGVAGIALVVIGIGGLHVTSWTRRARSSSAVHTGAGAGWAVLTGLTIAAYSLVDKAGVARLHPLPYIGFLGLGSSLLLLPAILARPDELRREWARNWRAIVAASAMNLTAYLLVLFAFRLSKTGYVVATRELSVVLSAFIGSLWFGEGPLAPLAIGAAVVFAGMICIATAS